MNLKLRGLILPVLMMLSFYQLADMSGLVDEFNKSFNKKSDTSGYITKVESSTILNVSFLIDPEIKDFNIYSGTMKKSAVDRMDHIESKMVKFNSGVDKQTIQDSLHNLAKKVKANVVIIDSAYKETKSITTPIESALN
jgi:hypothetical protein